MIDTDIIESKFDIIDTNLKFLDQYSDKTIDDIKNSYKDIQAMKFSLFEITSIICNFSILSECRFRKASSPVTVSCNMYATIFMNTNILIT